MSPNKYRYVRVNADLL